MQNKQSRAPKKTQKITCRCEMEIDMAQMIIAMRMRMKKKDGKIDPPLRRSNQKV